jgi:hypothetical protein
VTLCDQLEAYISRFAVDNGTKADAVGNGDAKQLAASDGKMIKKDDVDDKYGGTGGKKVCVAGPPQGNAFKVRWPPAPHTCCAWSGLIRLEVAQGKKGKRADKGASKPAAQRLNHSLDIISAFSKLKMSVPLTSDQVGNVSSRPCLQVPRLLPHTAVTLTASNLAMLCTS